MMCLVIDADASDDAPTAPHNDRGVLANLPRTRPQRSTPRRAAARSAAGAANGARKSGPRSEPGEEPSAKPRGGASRRPAGKAAGTADGSPRARATTKASGKGARGTRRRASTARAGVRPPKDAAPRQGFEGDGETASGSVQPPGGAELVATAAEIVGELRPRSRETGDPMRTRCSWSAGANRPSQAVALPKVVRARQLTP
jgi:hypothetical protein